MFAIHIVVDINAAWVVELIAFDIFRSCFFCVFHSHFPSVVVLLSGFHHVGDVDDLLVSTFFLSAEFFSLNLIAFGVADDNHSVVNRGVEAIVGFKLVVLHNALHCVSKCVGTTGSRAIGRSGGFCPLIQFAVHNEAQHQFGCCRFVGGIEGHDVATVSGSVGCNHGADFAIHVHFLGSAKAVGHVVEFQTAHSAVHHIGCSHQRFACKAEVVGADSGCGSEVVFAMDSFSCSVSIEAPFHRRDEVAIEGVVSRVEGRNIEFVYIVFAHYIAIEVTAAIGTSCRNKCTIRDAKVHGAHTYTGGSGGSGDEVTFFKSAAICHGVTHQSAVVVAGESRSEPYGNSARQTRCLVLSPFVCIEHTLAYTVTCSNTFAVMVFAITATYKYAFCSESDIGKFEDSVRWHSDA